MNMPKLANSAIKSLTVSVAIMLTISIVGPAVLTHAITKSDLKALLRGTPFYDPGADSATAQCNDSAPPSTTVAADTSVPADWGVRGKLAQLLFVSVGGQSEAQALIDAHVGGAFLQGKQFSAADKPWIDSLRNAPQVPILVGADEEGGKVQRLRDLETLASAQEMGKVATAFVQQLALQHATKMAAMGVTLDFAPVLDLDGGSSVISGQQRSFSADPNVVTEKAGAFAAGLRAGNVTPTFKHFPGHGYANGDSHAQVVKTPDISVLKGRDLKPYEALLATGEESAVMMGHLDVPGLTEAGLPASLSPAAYKLLRETYGFNGVVMTDDIGGMKAIQDRFGTEEAASRAIVAGADMVLFENKGKLTSVLDRLEADYRAKKITDERIQQSLDRIAKIRHNVSATGTTAATTATGNTCGTTSTITVSADVGPIDTATLPKLLATYTPEMKEIAADNKPNVQTGKQLAQQYGWDHGNEWMCLYSLWIGESHWDEKADNPTSSAYGIPQALEDTHAATIKKSYPDYHTNPATQIKWGLEYIKGKYKTPCNAVSLWNSRSPHWY